MDLPWYLGECRRVLRPGGWLLLSTHGTWLYHPHPTDFRRWTADGLVREIEAHGFTVERITGLIGPLAWTTQFRLLGYREVFAPDPADQLVGTAAPHHGDERPHGARRGHHAGVGPSDQRLYLCGCGS